MASCCYGNEYAELFTSKEAERDARRYRRRGLRRSERYLSSMLGPMSAGATVLEIGGGVGALQLELLEAGASTTTNVDLSPSWEKAARDLLEERSLTNRADRRIGDFVDMAEDLPEVDVVVLHRVVCCYPHWARMLDAAASRARRILAFTFPRRAVHVRLSFAIENILMRIRKRDFRAFLHPPKAMLQTLAEAGFTPTCDRSGLVWRTVVLER